jgi:hypothetical protein
MEGDAGYGFVFIGRQGERRMMILTPRDPFQISAQSFEPIKNNAPHERHQ